MLWFCHRLYYKDNAFAGVDTEEEFHGYSLSRNQVIKDEITSDCYRILYLPAPDNKDDHAYWIRVNSESNIPTIFMPQDVLEKLKIGTMWTVADSCSFPKDNELSENSIRRRDQVWNLIHNIVKQEPAIYISSQRSELLKIVEKASGVKINNLYGYLGKFWRGGFQINSLAPNYKKCGGARTATSLENRVGRRKTPGENGKVLTEEDFKNFDYAFKNYYQNGKGMSLQQAYKHMLSYHYVRPRFEGDPTPVTMGADEKPSFGQFYYWHRKHGNPVEDALARNGENHFNLNCRAIPGKTVTSLIGPGVCGQIDATIGDFYLVKKNDRSQVVGRPVIVIMKDAWSRLVTGMAVGLVNSSCDFWKEALLNAVTSKVEFCKRFGIEIKEDDWNCQGLPLSITTDNGEFAVKAIDDIVKKLRVTVENCPPYRGDLKGIIERTFGTVQITLKPYIPGYVEKDDGERGAKDYRKDACLDYDTFVAILIKVVLFYNNHHYLDLDTYDRSEEMRAKGIPAIPRDLWNYGTAHLTGSLRTVKPEDYLEALLKQGEATVTEKGIKHNNLYYLCDKAVEEKWMELARTEKRFNIPILYNPFSCAHIYTKSSDGTLLCCSLVNAYAQYENYTEAQRKEARQIDRETKAAYVQAENQAYSDLVHFIDSNVKRCQDEAKAGNEILGTLSRHSINIDREEEQKEVTGEAEARRSQAEMGYDVMGNPESAQPQDNSKNEDRPRSYDSISDEIDRIMTELGMGATYEDTSSND